MKKTTQIELRKSLFVLGVLLLGIVIGKYDKTTYASASESVITSPIPTGSGTIERVNGQSERSINTKRNIDTIPLERKYTGFSEQPDYRKEYLRRTLERYNSPLKYEVNAFIEVADKYNMDYRILPGIAFSESTLCKNYPTDTNNCYGWGMPLRQFISQRQAIQYIAEKINVSSPYYSAWRADKSDLYKLGTPYNGADIKFWVEKVQYFMEEVE